MAKPSQVIRLTLRGPDAAQAIAELRSTIQYDRLDVTVTVGRTRAETDAERYGRELDAYHREKREDDKLFERGKAIGRRVFRNPQA